MVPRPGRGALGVRKDPLTRPTRPALAAAPARGHDAVCVVRPPTPSLSPSRLPHSGCRQCARSLDRHERAQAQRRVRLGMGVFAGFSNPRFGAAARLFHPLRPTPRAGNFDARRVGRSAASYVPPLPLPLHVSFAPRHNSATPAEVDAMVAAVGFDSLDALIDATVPAAIRAGKELDLGEYTAGMTESAFLEKFK